MSDHETSWLYKGRPVAKNCGEMILINSDPLDERLAVEYGIEMISPHRGGWRRKRPKKTQDGRPLRHCYKRI
jgi:hypothetical protein